MPPKAKFTREQIISAALEFVTENGAEKLTARELADRLGSSPRPIFTVFEGMDEVMREVEEGARKVYTGYIDEGLTHKIAFKGVGEAYVRFATEKPKLFSLLFMRGKSNLPDIDSVLETIDPNADKILESIVKGYGVSIRVAEKLYRHLWIYTHGIAVATVTGVCRFDAEEISEMLTDVFVSLLKELKSRENGK